MRLVVDVLGAVAVAASRKVFLDYRSMSLPVDSPAQQCGSLVDVALVVNEDRAGDLISGDLESGGHL